MYLFITVEIPTLANTLNYQYRIVSYTIFHCPNITFFATNDSGVVYSTPVDHSLDPKIPANCA